MPSPSLLPVLVIILASLASLGCTSSEADTGGVTYTRDVQPILMAKCSPCHAGQMLGRHNVATTYDDVMKHVESIDAMGCWNDAEQTMPKTIGECTLISIMRGWMPMAMGCFNTPRPAECVSLEQEAVIADWVAAGMPR